MYIKSLSELIEYLENIKEEHGDVAVYKIFREDIEDFSDIITVNNLPKSLVISSKPLCSTISIVL